MIFTDRFNYTFGGEIPKILGKALYSNENSMKEFSAYNSTDKMNFINNSKNIKSISEAKNYVETMGESHKIDCELKSNYFK